MEIEKIDGFERYYVSKEGRIFRELVSRIDSHGYPSILFRRNKLYVYKSIHRLIAKIFIPNPKNLPFINHINGDKTDFRTENLEWCTQSENNAHALRTGLQTRMNGKYAGKQVH